MLEFFHLGKFKTSTISFADFFKQVLWDVV